MRPHNGKPKTGFKAGRNKAPRPSSATDKVEKRKKKLASDENELDSRLEGLEDDLRDTIDSIVTGEDTEDAPDNVDRFAKEFRKMRKKVGASNDHFNAENVNQQMLRSMLAMVLDIIPLAERAYRKTRKENAAYALNALLEQAKNLSTDLRMAKDVEQQAEFIKGRVLNPVLMAFANMLVQETLAIKSSVDTHVSNRKEGKRVKLEIDRATLSLGKYLTEAITKMTSDIDSYLSGDMEKLMPTPKKRKEKRS